MFIALVTLVAGYTILLWVGVSLAYSHLRVLLLVFQYFLIFPILILYLRSVRDRATDQQLSLPGLSLVAWVFVLVALPVSWFSTQGLLNPDESGYTFEARILLTGHIKAPPLPGAAAYVRETPREVQFGNHVLRPDGWFPKFPPGWPVILAIAEEVRLPWIVTPILGVLSLIAIAAIGRQLFSSDAVLLAVCFAVLSPFYLVNSIGLMSHSLCGYLTVLAAYCLFRGLDTGHLSYFWGMFACLAFAAQVRPYTAFAVGVVMTGAALWHTRANSALSLRIVGVACFLGGIAVGAFLLCNHLYTGNWLVSPYAAAAGTSAPPELSLRPSGIFQGLTLYGRQAFQENLFSIFPFAYLLAGYALFTEQERRREVWILAAIYFGLVLAYLAHPYGSGIFFGERFHFEAAFSVFILAARGATLLAQRWKIPGKTTALVLLALSFLQISHQALAILSIAQQSEPYRKVRSMTARAPSGVVFLQDGPGFVAKHFNINQADWPHARHVFLIDADPNHRNEWACRLHVSTWTVAQYDPETRSALLTTEPAMCGSSTALMP